MTGTTTRKGSGAIITRTGAGQMGDKTAGNVPDRAERGPLPNWFLKFLWPNLPPGETVDWTQP